MQNRGSPGARQIGAEVVDYCGDGEASHLIPRVRFYQRRPRLGGHYSAEFVFEDVRARLSPRYIKAEVAVAPFFSNGVIRRLAIATDAWCRQDEITHVTGDINFAAIALDPRRTVLTVLDCGFVARSRGWKRRILKTLWLDLPVLRMRYITTISGAMRDEIVTYTRCNPEKVRVIPVAISENFKFSSRICQSAQPRVLQIGTAPNKNVDRLVDALGGMNCTLVVVGPVSDKFKARVSAAGLVLENYVNLPQERVVEEYAKCDLVAFASTYEGFGMPILEGNAVGRPVLTSNTSSMPEVADGAACLVDPYDVQSIRRGVERILYDEAYRSCLIERGRENVKRYAGDVIAHQYLSIYREMLMTASGRLACELD